MKRLAIALSLIAAPVLAQDDEDAVMEIKGLKPDFAIQLAQGAM